ncbi:hypothetical protein ILUMI_08192 [Ignelater luminosus]|uniref:Uncharacterized protein n=1 Tax=Ignelater luminosus TaxID=2038154 RepID=A0A8K0DBT9_IGNLU|nr:hypothetical protein ILUMI_08192 [Ignelater luminosus]
MMARNFFTSLFGGKRKQESGEEDVKTPERRLSISKSGRMKERNRQRQTLTDSVFCVEKSEGKSMNISELKKELGNNTTAKLNNETRKPSLSSEELNIDDIIKEIKQTAL